MLRRNTIIFILLALLTAILFVADIAVGSVSVPLREVAAALTGRCGDEAIRSIVIEIRLVKAVMAVVAGCALAVAGLQMQTLFRNPLAGPYVLGVSAGASLGVALFLLGTPLLGAAAVPALHTLGVAGAAWVGAAAVLAAVLWLSRRIRDIMAILILGMMLASAIGATVEILQYLGSETSLKSFVVWTMGSLGDVTAVQLRLILPVAAAGVALAVSQIKPLNMLLPGETYAETIGLNIAGTRRTVFISTVLLAGTVTAFCGPIGFVGLAVPHLARMLFASADHRTLMPASALAGTAMMLGCDIISKRLGLPINTVTALTGIPIVMYIVISNRNLMR